MEKYGCRIPVLFAARQTTPWAFSNTTAEILSFDLPGTKQVLSSLRPMVTMELGTTVSSLRQTVQRSG